MSSNWRAENVAKAREVARKKDADARAELARQIPALLEKHKSLTAAAAVAGVTRAMFRRAAKENGIAVGQPAALSVAAQARIEKQAARRRDMAERLPALMKERGSLHQVSASERVSREWLTSIILEFGLEHLLWPKPPEPVSAKQEVVLPPPRAVTVAEEYRPAQSSQRQVQALNLLRRGRDATDVMRETNLPLREVYRLQAEVREERRAQRHEGMRA